MVIVQFMASEGWGGAEKVFVDLANELGRNHDVYAILLRNTIYINRFAPHVKVIVLKSNPTRHNPLLSYEIYSVLKSLRPDIIHTHAVKGSELVAGVNRWLGFNHVATKHNVRKGKIFNKLPWVTAVSSSSKRTIKAADGDRVEVIHNGLTPVEVNSVTKSDIFTLLAVGRLDKLKGFDILIKQVKNLEFDFKLIIAGAGPEFEPLSELTANLGLQNRVELLGLREDIPQLMKQVHGVVISSHAEGFCQVAIEALFYADILISTPVGICSELLPPQFLCELDQLATKISDVYNQYGKYEQQFFDLREQRAGDFFFHEITKQYTNFYREMRGTGDHNE